MPPRKRKRLSRATSLTPSSQPKTPTPAEASPVKEDELLLNDPWTDEEEIGLFKGLMRWKPTGIHKHFHVLNLHQYLLDGGYIHPGNEHTKPAGIWRKLEQLYNLEALDEREDSRQLEKMELPSDEEDESEAEDDADVYSEAANKIENEDFELPGEDFARLKWANRLASEKQKRDESPPVLPEVNMADDPPVRFTPSFSIEPSESATPAARAGRGRAGTAASRGRAPATGRRKSARQTEEPAEVDNEGEEDEEEHSEENGDSEAGTPATRGTRSTKPAQPRSSARSKAKGRGRAR